MVVPLLIGPRASPVPLCVRLEAVERWEQAEGVAPTWRPLVLRDGGVSMSAVCSLRDDAGEVSMGSLAPSLSIMLLACSPSMHVIKLVGNWNVPQPECIVLSVPQKALCSRNEIWVGKDGRGEQSMHSSDD